MSRRHTTHGVFKILAAILLVTVQITQTQCDDNVRWMEGIAIHDDNLKVNETTTVHMDETVEISLTITQLNKQFLLTHNATVHLVSDSELLNVAGIIPVDEIDKNDTWHGNVTISAIFIGRANVFVRVKYAGDRIEDSPTKLPVIIIRRERIIDTIFIVSVASLMTILYVNFGAALDIQKVKGVIFRPVGPGIAFFCHFIVLPLVNFLLLRKCFL